MIIFGDTKHKILLNFYGKYIMGKLHKFTLCVTINYCNNKLNIVYSTLVSGTFHLLYPSPWVNGLNVGLIVRRRERRVKVNKRY